MQPHVILIVDDLESDRRLLELAFQKSTQLRIGGLLENGEQTMDYLKGTGPYADREKYPFPEVVILNYRMPRISGVEVLEWLRTQALPPLKVMVISGSLDAENKRRVLELGAWCYFEKPMELTGWSEMARYVENILSGSEQG
ncbi:response regulator [Pedosphaera parvula]|uniref:Response regulator receiver protein n=1 Tax=Pedosphaera parvula (strain Ellin514) TaxID=320771 RepID=B9XGD4_PEDPL|nr:response regulator [Pedosphaera parvula]EEF60985.1 response regulator receiver protein [Pedosphaera parvula Ellin514]